MMATSTCDTRGEPDWRCGEEEGADGIVAVACRCRGLVAVGRRSGER